MSISKTVFETLFSEYSSGMTQEEVAAKHNVRQGQIQKLLANSRSAGGLLLDTVDKMFPNATVNLYGDSVSIHAVQNHGAVVGVNRGTITHDRDLLFEIENKILAADELTDEEKVKVLRVLKKG